jgi:hypothetical protein
VTKVKKRVASRAKPPRRTAAKSLRTVRTKRRATARRAAATPVDTLLADIRGAERRDVGRVRLDIVRAGKARVKREIYPPGFRWSKDMKPVTGTDVCMHAHVGFLARGEIHVEYPDGCAVEFKAPQVVAIEPGHDGWVVGREPAVLIEFDFERDTIERLGMPERHRH